MTTFRYILSFLFVFISLVACEEEKSWTISPSEKQIIIDAIITSESGRQEISISESSQELNGEVTPVGGAEIRFQSENGNYTFTEDLPGVYVANDINLEVGKTYRLIVAINGVRDTAEAIMHPVSALYPLNFEPRDSSGYKFNYTGSDQPSMMDVYYNWSGVQEMCDSFGACEALQTYYKLNNIDFVEYYQPPKQEIIFPNNTTIVRKQYSLSEAHQEFVRSLLTETEWRGGLFDVEHGNIPTNFKNSFRGWFAVCQTISDTTYIP